MVGRGGGVASSSSSSTSSSSSSSSSSNSTSSSSSTSEDPSDKLFASRLDFVNAATPWTTPLSPEIQAALCDKPSTLNP